MTIQSRSVKIILLLLVVLAIGAIILVFLRQRQPATTPTVSPGSADESAIVLNRVHHTASRDGRTQWELEAASARYVPDSNSAVFTDLQVVFFLDDGGRMHLQAKQGILDTSTNNMQIIDDIVVTYDDFTLKTQKLDYHHQSQQFTTNVPVKIMGRQFDLSAHAMTFNITTRKARMSGQVTGHLHEPFSF